MSRVNVTVEIPANEPDQMTSLAENVRKKHLELGTASPLNGLSVDGFSKLLDGAIADRNDAKSLHNQAEVKNQSANLKLGIDKSQNSKTPNTIYSFLISAKDILLGLNNGNEKKLSEWGFNVSISTSAASKAKTATK
jgi:hypothetical protein